MTLRDLLRQTAHNLGSKGIYTHDEVINFVRKHHPDALSADARKLEDIGLRRILNDIESKQSRHYNPDQLDMLSELHGLPHSYDAKMVGMADERGSRVLLGSVPIRSLRGMANYQPNNKRLSPAEKITALLKKLAPFIVSEDESLSDVIHRSRSK